MISIQMVKDDPALAKRVKMIQRRQARLEEEVDAEVVE
jgi:hypothetical protein